MRCCDFLPDEPLTLVRALIVLRRASALVPKARNAVADYPCQDDVHRALDVIHAEVDREEGYRAEVEKLRRERDAARATHDKMRSLALRVVVGCREPAATTSERFHRDLERLSQFVSEVPA